MKIGLYRIRPTRIFASHYGIYYILKFNDFTYVFNDNNMTQNHIMLEEFKQKYRKYFSKMELKSIEEIFLTGYEFF